MKVLRLALLLSLLAPAALAADGVTEINQARALAGFVVASDAPGFPVTLSGPGSYVLTGDLTVPDENTSAILIAGNEITLDLNGFALLGPVTCTGDGSALSCSATGTGRGVDGATDDFVTVRNGLVRGFGGAGILLDGYARIENVIVRENGSNGLELGEGGLVRDSVFHRNGASGSNAGHYATYADCAASRNKTAGLVGDEASVFLRNVANQNGAEGVAGLFGTNVLHGNTAYANEIDGMRSSASGILTRNVAAGNANRGFFLNSSASYGQNMVYKAGTGIATVVGGLNLGNNQCSDTGTLSACP